MKKLLAGIVAFGLMTPLASMATDTGPGCGLGTQVMKGKSGLVFNVLAATTNGISGNQTFGMTFGTLGCNGEQMVSNEYQKEIFVASNMDTLAVDAAKGQGNHLASLAELIGVQAAERNNFYSMAQSEYNVIFSEANQSPSDVLAAFDVAMKSDVTLAKYVK